MARDTVLEQVEQCWRGVAPDPDLVPAPDENLFRGDVDSFVFIQFVRALGARFQVELPLVEIFENPTFRTVADCIGRTGE
ncbi:acyl carrier protein [Actinosynnema sp. NPDC047251]|uniref:Amino acid thiolation domain containing protein n=1 Tax=Saccharothrix espanaensis (strain ATCC 51144 / DSM 44229 / JCM 9112 / NBRC 15066 / NRRL 15764) TaxID=1179773 RepID=K0JVT5_SACES|nr:acyl carrier protein [Saccharothrix espanaensis]CCH29567.1 Amino acid thiolation domain containing protein [Saccharothrix espanaensis DSM 44229]